MYMSDWTGKGSGKTPTVDNLAKISNSRVPICTALKPEVRHCKNKGP